MINGLRNDFQMPGVPIRIHFKAGDNPFENRRKKR
jgi:GTP-binding protein